MARHHLACVVALLMLSTATEQSRWSRQISSYTSDLSDWVPLPGPIERQEPPLPPIKRQAVAEPRILAEPVFPGFQRPTGFTQDFPGRTYINNAANRQLYLQSVPAVPSAPQNYLSDQGFGQGLRFGLAQPNFPLNQAFVSPQLSFDSAPQSPLPPLPANQRQKVAFVSNPVAFPKSNLGSPQTKPFINQAPTKSEGQKTVDGYRLEGVTNFQSMKKPQSLQKLKYESYDKVPRTEMIPPRAKSEKEEVQLLYVPIESLNKGHFNFRAPAAAPQVPKQTNLNNQNIQKPVINSVPAATLPKQTFAGDFHRPAAQQYDRFNPKYYNFNSQYQELDQVPKFSSIATPIPTTLPTTPKPKKLKPHQPPLAIFLASDSKRGNQVKVGDVLTSLKNADSVAVLDSVNPQTAPKVFIGPSNLTPPENFARFELPYLSNIEHSDKKLRQLPFFVAPLSYNTPQGFAKIPFPSPHVGSVVINSQIKDHATQPSPAADVIPNSYTTSPQSYSQRQEQKSNVHQQQISDVIPNSYTTSSQTYSPRQEHKPNIRQQPQKQYIQQQEPKPETQKFPSVSFFTASPPKTNAPVDHKSNYYSFEPQTVSTVRPINEPHDGIVSGAPKQPGSYFLTNNQGHLEEVPFPNYNLQDLYGRPPQEPAKQYKQTQSTTPTTTVSSTTTKPSTYPNQLLETHNPYSINQAFQFSTPLDYHNLFEENYATPRPEFPQQSPRPTPREPQLPSVSPSSSTPSSPAHSVETLTEKSYQTSPNYLQNNYSPEIHYDSELTDVRYPFNNNEYTTKSASEYSQSSSENNNYSERNTSPSDYTSSTEAQSVPMDHLEPLDDMFGGLDDLIKSPYYQRKNNQEASKESNPTSSTTTTTTTTTRRTPIRNRGRPRYTTPKADSNESTIRTVVTRRPLKERRPLPSRTKYEANKIANERVTRKPVTSSETSTKYTTRSRTRGRVQYKPTESDEYYKTSKVGSSKENDLAYQRDVLHQNYPVTIMERSSTHDIEAITEPLPKISSTKLSEPFTEVYDTDNAYSYDRAAVSEHIPNVAPNSKEDAYTTKAETETENNVSKFSPLQEQYTYQSRSSLAPVDAISQYDDITEKDDFGKQTTSSLRSEDTDPWMSVSEQSPSNFPVTDLPLDAEEGSFTRKFETTTVTSHETTPEEEHEENVVQTTPSYNRVRVRPGVVRQYQQSTSTESSRGKTRRPAQPVTYRPAFDRRRTTMRIEEIEADLKTKPLHSRPEQEYRHPVYKPEPTTEPSVTTSYSQEASTKRGAFRRRRPSYSTTTTSTEAGSSAMTKRTYEVKNRFRGRRPTTEKASTEILTDAPSTTRSTSYSRYTRPRLSERFNKKPVDNEEADDQESNYSINRPKYIEPENEHWWSKASTDSFKPYNPNEISDDRKNTSPQDDNSQDIITARNNDYDDILLTVTPATNNKNRTDKKIPDIPPTLEALVEQSKTTKSDAANNMSTFETILEEVMKSLDEQDANEYTKNVMKHKGGEIGEIPPERIISSGDSFKSTTPAEPEATTTMTTEKSSHTSDEKDTTRRRGFWKKVKVRPVTTESFEVAESQHYTSTVNRLGDPVGKTVHNKVNPYDKPKVTTYKPAYQFLQNIFQDPEDDVYPIMDLFKIDKSENNTKTVDTTTAVTTTTRQFTKKYDSSETDLGTGSPDSTLESLFTTSTELTTKESNKAASSGAFSFMDYLFGATVNDENQVSGGAIKTGDSDEEPETTLRTEEIKITTEKMKPRLPTTESTFIPEEITASTTVDENHHSTKSDIDTSDENSNEDDEKESTTVKPDIIETSSVSSYMNPANVVSTSMSTEVSHETEICFRGKCIKSTSSTDML